MLKHRNSLLLLIVLVAIFSGCQNKDDNTVLIWTNKSDIVSYAEVFNSEQSKVKVVVSYKEKISLPNAKDEKCPDIVIGSGICNENTRKNFSSIGHLFHNPKMKRSQFYESVLDCGKIGHTQYLIPISFNLPLVIFTKENENLVPNDYLISLDELRDISAKYNKKNARGIYTSIGFAPRWNDDFMYTVAKMQNVDFKFSDKKEERFVWNQSALDGTVSYLKNWTLSNNTSSSAEEDYAFKYLYMPEYKQVSLNRCLFESMTSDEFFSLPDDKIHSLEYRWLCYEDKIPLEDDMVFLGLYRKSENTTNAEKFIVWLLSEETQQKVVERNQSMKLNTLNFGVLGGFSSLQSVNEKVLTKYTPSLRKNLPLPDYLESINLYPEQWQSIKESVIYPYLLDSTNTSVGLDEIPISQRMKHWKKQYF